MTNGPAPRVTRVWDWLTGKHAKKSPYWMILGPTLALTFIGVVMVLSASSVEYIGGRGSFASLKSQGLYAVIGLGLMMWISRWNTKTVKKLAVPILLGSILLLLLVFTPLGREINGNRNWIYIGGMSFQPSEAAKLGLSIWSAYALSQKLAFQNTVKDLLIPVVVPFGGLLVLLVMLGKDLGTVLIMLLILAVVLFLAGMQARWLVGAGLIGLIGVAAVTMQSSNRMLRIQAWLGQCDHPKDPCYQYEQGIFALASGGWTGVGLGQSRQKWSYIPEAGNDFIFTIVGEELGLLGALLVIGLFITLGLGMFRVAYNTSDSFIRLSTGSIMTWLLGQAFMNIAMVTGLLPVIGVPLPFISAGGSALLMSILAVGVVLSFTQRSDPNDQQEHQSAVRTTESMQS